MGIFHVYGHFWGLGGGFWLLGICISLFGTGPIIGNSPQFFITSTREFIFDTFWNISDNFFLSILWLRFRRKKNYKENFVCGSLTRTGPWSETYAKKSYQLFLYADIYLGQGQYFCLNYKTISAFQHFKFKYHFWRKRVVPDLAGLARWVITQGKNTG